VPSAYNWPTGSGDLSSASFSKSDLSRNVSKALIMLMMQLSDQENVYQIQIPHQMVPQTPWIRIQISSRSQLTNPCKQKDYLFSTIESRVSFFEK